MGTTRSHSHHPRSWFHGDPAPARAMLLLAALVAGLSVGIAPVAASATSTATTEVLSAPLVYTTDGARVFVIDSAAEEVLTSIPVPGAGALAITADGGTVYVSTPAGISVIDAPTNTVTGTVPLPTPVGEIVLSADGSLLYGVTGTALLTIDLTSGSVVSNIPVSGFALAIPTPTRAYVADYPAVSIVDLTTGAVVGTPVLAAERHAIYDLASAPDGQRVYVVESQERFIADRVDVINTATETVVDVLPAPQFSNAVAVSPDGARLYVTSDSGAEFYDTTTFASDGFTSMNLDAYFQLAFTPDGSTAFATTGFIKNVEAIDTSTFETSRIVLRDATPPVYAIAASPVALPDTFAPGCDIEYISNDGRLFTVFDTGAGLRSVDTTGSSNVRLQPSFTPGATTPVVFTGFLVDRTQPGHARLRLTDELGQSSTCTADYDAVPGATTTSTARPATSTTAPTSTTAATSSTSTSTTVPGPSGNALDDDTATLEGSIGQWAPWFSSNPSRSSTEAHGGTHSLQVDVTDPHGWGVQLGNYPGFFTGPGHKTIGFWARAGSGTGLGATLTVSWRDATDAVLRTDAVAVSNLGAAWQEASAVVTAPPGTASVDLTLSGSRGAPGDRLYLDDLVVADTAEGPPPPPPDVRNALDDDTATLEGSIGRWAPWFSSNPSRSSTEAHGGTHSLQVDITDPYGWGVQLGNYPGFAASPGPKVASFWGRSPDTGLGATMTLSWRDAADDVLGTDTVTLALGGGWQQTARVVAAPPGTTSVDLTFTDPGGLPGDTVFLDDIRVGQAANALDADTARAQDSVGAWVGWFSAIPSRSTARAHRGAASLKVDVTDPYGWGIQLDNYPGFATTAGPKVISFWVLAGSGIDGSGATMTVYWRDASNAVLGTDQVSFPAGADGWEEAIALVTAPAGTQAVDVTVTDPEGGSGDSLFIDDVAIADR